MWAWWDKQSPFNKLGLAFVGAVIVLVLLVAVF
jgi:hypothetical protein